jgi:2-polyprenyl-6-methoxyphenol hydroxylase-like FAD-dependent oxidoreductase
MNYQKTFPHNIENRPSAETSHAVIIGGSLAGLLAARVLADHFDRVTVVERDHFPDGPEPRRGIPQARHVHALMIRGRMIMEDLFPGLTGEMIASGAHFFDMAEDVAWLTPAGWGIRFRSGLMILSFTRDLLDWHVRRRLASNTAVRFLDGCDVTGLLPDPANKGVSGVLLRSRRQAEVTSLRATLVVEAGGRGSRAAQWLEDLGYSRPQETVINGHIGYASRLYQPARGGRAEWKGLFIQSAPPADVRGGLIMPVEGDRWLVTLIGGDRDYPPSDEEGFLEFARSLRSPELYDALREAEPLTPIAPYRATENRLHYYEKVSGWPEGFVVLGDAVCAFNPVYGQGMTNAARCAQLLDQCVRERPDLSGLGQRFQQKLAKINTEPWLLSTGQDYRYRSTEGGSPDWKTRLMHRYMNQVIRLSTEEVSVRRRLLEVFNMLEPPAALLRPRIFIQALRRAFSLTRRSRPRALRQKDVSDAAL